jgi:hypothetical protein
MVGNRLDFFGRGMGWFSVGVIKSMYINTFWVFKMASLVFCLALDSVRGALL